MAFAAIRPEVIKPSKPKIMISGEAGFGKTFFALSAIKPYFIDTEGGAVRPQYMKKLIAGGGAYLGKEQGSQDFKTVNEQIKELATTKHSFKTLILDSFSKLYNTEMAIQEDRVGNDFGKDKKEANRPTRQLIRWIERLDMTVILICHYKEKWKRKGKDLTYQGSTFDGYDKMEYDLDLWIEAQKAGNQRTYVVKKSRIDALPEGQVFPLDYKNFCELYGEDIINKETEVLALASVEQVVRIKKLLEVVRIEQAEIDKWWKKAGIENWEEMLASDLEKCIVAIDKKLDKSTI